MAEITTTTRAVLDDTDTIGVARVEGKFWLFAPESPEGKPTISIAITEKQALSLLQRLQHYVGGARVETTA